MTTGTRHSTTTKATGILLAGLLALLVLTPLRLSAQGMPFIRNYKATEYNGHNQNFDIICGDEGLVYVANFEGLLYYDQSTWRMIHTPGNSRVTALFRDSKGRIWTGGYNFMGYLKTGPRGILALHPTGNGTNIRGEVTWIWERDGRVSFLVSDGKVYDITGDNIQVQPNGQVPTSGWSVLGSGQHVNQIQTIDDNTEVVATNGNGLLVRHKNGQPLMHINEANGLCSNNVSHVSYNGNGLLWGATDNGIFAIALPTAYTHFTQSEGLHGEVLSLAKFNGTIYAGTLNGLYRLEGQTFRQVADISHACWCLTPTADRLLAATTNGVYLVGQQGTRQLTTASTTAVTDAEDGYYTGEMDGFYYHPYDGQEQKVCEAERVTKILRDANGTLWLQNIYGYVWKGDGTRFQPVDTHREPATIVMSNGHVNVITASATRPFPYPQYSYTDEDGISWLTNNKGKSLYAFDNHIRQHTLSQLVYPLMDFSTRAMLRDKRQLWMGGDRGLNVVDYARKDIMTQVKPQLYIRSILLRGDSILWGGSGRQPAELPSLSSDERHIQFNFSVAYPSLLLRTQYRTRMNGGYWSAWDTNTYEEYNHQSYGTYYFEVQARDAYGRLSDVVGIRFTIDPPLYLRWYMLVLYVLIATALILVLVKWRLNRLEHEKMRLERIVKERTAEVVKLEKVATVAKLTQGLIDRILNPLNYINNFSKLSEGLVEDVRANVEDEKDHIDPDTYEDTLDVLDMLKGNLAKVGEHGASTTRTLKAMEEMLKDRSGGKTQIDLVILLRQNEKMVHTYYEREISEHHIQVTFSYGADTVPVEGNGEQLSKTFMSLLANAVYAVRKQHIRKTEQHEAYHPEVNVSIRYSGPTAEIRIRDNGIGIEHTIIDKVFDPFFTTKTTSEASGVGLYLSKEIIQDHGGDITVDSEKNVYTEFTITLPHSPKL